MNRLEEVMQRIGARPALIRIACAGDHFGDNAPYRIEEGIAIIDIRGPLSNAAWSWRGTTYGEIQEQLKIASADPNVRGILLNVNSPGGETDNAFETAGLIAALEKPCYAVAGTVAYSAAYLLASQADKLYCMPISGGVGSIGVYCAHMDLSGALEQAGIKMTLISAGKGKTDGNPYEPLSDAAREEMQGEIDRLYGEFVGAVARGRSLAATDIVKMGARCVEGAAAAIAAGLADAPGDLSTGWVGLCNEIQQARLSFTNGRLGFVKSSAASAARKEPFMAETQAAESKVPTPAEIETMVSEARAAGFADASQIVTLCALAGTPARAAEFITARKSIADASAALLAAKVEADEKLKLNPGLLPGAAEQKEGAQGKADPWGKVLKAIGVRTKEQN